MKPELGFKGKAVGLQTKEAEERELGVGTALGGEGKGSTEAWKYSIF